MLLSGLPMGSGNPPPESVTMQDLALNRGRDSPPAASLPVPLNFSLLPF